MTVEKKANAAREVHNFYITCQKRDKQKFVFLNGQEIKLHELFLSNGILYFYVNDGKGGKDFQTSSYNANNQEGTYILGFTGSESYQDSKKWKSRLNLEIEPVSDDRKSEILQVLKKQHYTRPYKFW